MTSHPAQTKKELTELLRAAARRGDYLHLCELAERPFTYYAHLGFSAVCSVQERICNALAEDAAAPRAGEPASATAARCLQLEADGALQLARKAIHKNRGGCAEAVEAGCQLITAILRGASQEMLTRVVSSRNALLPVVMDVVSRDFTAVPEAVGDESPAISYAACCDALLALAGLHRDAPPHALKPPARVVTYGHLQLFRRRVLEFHSYIPSTLLDHVLWATNLLCDNDYVAGSSVKRALLRLLRSTGRVMRLLICLSLCSGTERGWLDAKQLITDVFDLVNDDDNLENWHLMRWVIVYVFLPLACAAQLPVETMAEDSVGAEPWYLPFTVSFCLGRCCIRRGGMTAIWRDSLIALLDDSTGDHPAALELTAIVTAMHDCCVRPAAHLFTWLARGDEYFKAKISAFHKSAADLAKTQRPSTRTRSRKNAAPPSADGDDDPDGGSDGERLSEWGSDNDDGEPPRVTARTESTPALTARAMRAASGESREDVDARRAAADAAAAALLAELEAEPSKPAAASAGSGKKKKKKKKSAAKSAAAAKALPASDAEDSDGDDTVAACQDDDPAPVPAAAPRAELHLAPRPAPVPVIAPRSTAAVPRPVPRPAAPLPAAVPLQPASAAEPFQRKGRLGAASCGCGNAACATPASHAPAAQAKEEEVLLEDLFPWLAVQPAQEPAQPADAAHEDDDLCVICLDKPRETALSGCAAAHPPALCRGCAAQVLAGAAPVCPLCRAPAAPC